MKKDLILVGDRILIEPDGDQEKTDSGLYLPQDVKEKEKVNTGRIIKTGPGYPIPDPSLLDQEPWVKTSRDKYFPLQAREGDYCIYLRAQATEIQFEGKHLVVVPYSAILVLMRDSLDEGLPDL